MSNVVEQQNVADKYNSIINIQVHRSENFVACCDQENETFSFVYELQSPP